MISVILQFLGRDLRPVQDWPGLYIEFILRENDYIATVPVQALALMAAFKDEWPCLIIVPSSLRGELDPEPHTLVLVTVSYLADDSPFEDAMSQLRNAGNISAPEVNSRVQAACWEIP